MLFGKKGRETKYNRAVLELTEFLQEENNLDRYQTILALAGQWESLLDPKVVQMNGLCSAMIYAYAKDAQTPEAQIDARRRETDEEIIRQLSEIAPIYDRISASLSQIEALKQGLSPDVLNNEASVALATLLATDTKKVGKTTKKS